MNTLSTNRGDLKSTAMAIESFHDTDSGRNALRAKAALIRSTLAVIGIQLLLRAMMMLRQLNY